VIARAPTGTRGRRGETHRVFLDANVLFSAAYRADSALERLWTSNTDIALLSSPYAIEEASRNLEERDARSRPRTLITALEIVPDIANGNIPPNVKLPDEDLPILLAAIAAGATHLLTGDRAHFGAYFGRRAAGVLIQRPGDYLAARRLTDEQR
jgi:predicted nucleic acid-binding protein